MGLKENNKNQIIQGDCIDVMKGIDDNSIDDIKNIEGILYDRP